MKMTLTGKGTKAGLVALAAVLSLWSCENPAVGSSSLSHVDSLLAQYSFESGTKSSTGYSAIDGINPLTLSMTTSTDDTTANTEIEGKVGDVGILTGSSNVSTQGGTIESGLLAPEDSALTISAWIKATSDWSNLATIGGIMIDLPNFYSSATSHVYPGLGAVFGTYDVSGTETTYIWSDLINQSDWILVTVVFDPKVGISYYKNGDLVLTYPISLAVADTIIKAVVAGAQSDTILVGKTNGDPAVSLDDLRFYNYALSATEVLSLYGSY